MDMPFNPSPASKKRGVDDMLDGSNDASTFTTTTPTFKRRWVSGPSSPVHLLLLSD